jgi:NAD(P)-dependent dehydrogenase (short-subunit alcohol dehydrogenase family)
LAKNLNAMNNEPSVQKLFDLSGRTALLTGASGHLGRSMANALAEAGARVIVASRDAKTGAKVATELAGPECGQHFPVVIDHMDERSTNAGFDKVVRKAKKVDVLVCNGHESLGKDLRSVTGAEFSRQLQNATGYFLLVRKFHDQIVRQKSHGSVIMIGSMYGVVGSYPETYEGIGPANPVAYQALKGGIIQMVRHLAVYWAKDGIRVNCLSPGPFPSKNAKPALVRRLKNHSPMHRIGQPHELKGALIFLASDASSYVTGQNLLVDGGWTAW